MYAMKNKYANGFSHILVIALLVIGLLFALGWIFWQNFIYNDSSTNEYEILTVSENNRKEKVSQDKTPKESVEQYSGKVVTTHKGAFSFKIPNGWEVINVINNDMITQKPGGSSLYKGSTPPVVESTEAYGHDAPVFHSELLTKSQYEKNKTQNSSSSYNSMRSKFTLDDATEGTKYERHIPAKANDGPFCRENDCHSYSYYFAENNKYVGVYWSIYTEPGVAVDTNQLKYVEYAVKSLVIN
jgi:hypothetical protein